MRLVRPFLKVLSGHPGIPEGLLDPLHAMDPDDRLAIESVHELLRGGVELTGDPDLGLKAAREFALGEFGALEYVASSAPNVRDAIVVIGRYMHLINDALTFSTHVDGAQAVLRLDSALPLPRAAEAFEAAAFHIAAERRLVDVSQSPMDVHFMHEAPLDTREYALTFGPSARIHFDQEFTGFTVATVALDAPLPARDPVLHAMLHKHAENLLKELPAVETFSARVREMIVSELSGGDSSLEHVAARLQVSARTLARRLDAEGSSLKDLRDDLRRGMALRYASTTDLQLSEIALLLGFASAAAFHRAFKRWTGQAPIEYRRRHRG